MIRSVLFFLIFSVSYSVFSDAKENNATTEGAQPAVTFSTNYKNLSMERAYQLQKGYVRNQATHGGATFVGFKIELNSPQKQQQYGVNEPITGVLLEKPLAKEGLRVLLDQKNNLMVKPGLAFKVTSAIKEPVTSIDQLKKAIKQVAAVVELPEFNFTSDNYNGFDIVANNAMAGHFILGEWQTSEQDVDAIYHQLFCNTNVLNGGSDSSIHIGQWQTLQWMVNHLIQQGYALRKGQILLTGSLEGMVAAQKCQYKADFSQLGSIQFTIE